MRGSVSDRPIDSQLLFPLAVMKAPSDLWGDGPAFRGRPSGLLRAALALHASQPIGPQPPTPRAQPKNSPPPRPRRQGIRRRARAAKEFAARPRRSKNALLRVPRQAARPRRSTNALLRAPAQAVRRAASRRTCTGLVLTASSAPANHPRPRQPFAPVIRAAPVSRIALRPHNVVTATPHRQSWRDRQGQVLRPTWIGARVHPYLFDAKGASAVPVGADNAQACHCGLLTSQAMNVGVES